MSSGSYAIKMKFNLNVKALMEVAEASELYNGLDLDKTSQQLLNYVRGVFRALSNIWDGAFCPGPTKSSRLNFYHWNLDGIAAHDFVKVPLLEAFIKANNADIICSSGTFLDSTIQLNDERLYIMGYLRRCLNIL